MLKLTPSEFREVRLPWSALLSTKGKELWIKATGRRTKGQGMIAADTRTVREGFAALRGDDFSAYNLPQVWVESRQIPQAVSGRVPATDAVVVDLGCGPGMSTQLLCHFADPSWSITGFDLTSHLIERARAREYRNRRGELITPRFECQDISEPLLIDGVPIAPASVDFAVSGGVVGLYLTHAQATSLAKELARVIKPGGYAAVDAGPSVPVDVLRKIMMGAGFEQVATAKSFFIEPRPKLVFVKPGPVHLPR
ncbi:MAG: class I SAM-dependent methyltransferase [Phycisphaerales bacterium]